MLSAAIYFIGITQLLYVVPLIIFLWHERRLALMKGVIIGATMIALINFGYLLFLVNQYR